MANNKYPHSTVCAECGNVTKIPFIPDGITPIYCSECLSMERDDELEVNTQSEFYKIFIVKLDKH
jgi:CxxC-x17-CxxC domain-containing protein